MSLFKFFLHFLFFRFFVPPSLGSDLTCSDISHTSFLCKTLLAYLSDHKGIFHCPLSSQLKLVQALIVEKTYHILRYVRFLIKAVLVAKQLQCCCTSSQVHLRTSWHIPVTKLWKCIKFMDKLILSIIFSCLPCLGPFFKTIPEESECVLHDNRLTLSVKLFGLFFSLILSISHLIINFSC